MSTTPKFSSRSYEGYEGNEYSDDLEPVALPPRNIQETAFQCKHNGVTPPLGYDVTPEKTYEINEKEAKIVKIIFDMYSKGFGYSEIIDSLNKFGYRTKIGNSFGKNSIHDLLKNEKYTGTYIFNKTERKVAGKRNSEY